jgi:hypothetical protein
VNRDSGTASANGGWLRRLVRPQNRHHKINPANKNAHKVKAAALARGSKPARAKPKLTAEISLIKS